MQGGLGKHLGIGKEGKFDGTIGVSRQGSSRKGSGVELRSFALTERFAGM